MRNSDADLVDVPDESQRRPLGGALHACQDRAERIQGDIREPLGGAAEGRGRVALVAGGTRRRQQLPEQVGDGHGPGRYKV